MTSQPAPSDANPAAAMEAAAAEAAGVLKMMANPQRLRLLCILLERDHTVGELEQALGASQAYVSTQLAKLRADGLVRAERDGRSVRYTLCDPRVTPILERLYEVFCR